MRGISPSPIAYLPLTTKHSQFLLEPLTKSVWRFVPLIDAPGQVQMAIDTWLLEQHRLGLQPSVLRFYTWSPPAISLGYHQRYWPQSWQSLVWQNSFIDLVRRPTGGRAVLHQGDLTYAVVTSGIAGNRTQVYETLCEFLIQGWRSLGVELTYGQAGRDYIHNPNCFGLATKADLILPNGFKLIGSAQLRRGMTILQHGSMRLEPDLALFNQVFGTCLETIQAPLALEKGLIATVIQALQAAICSCFNIQLRIQPLSDLEYQMALAQTQLVI
ncbi:MAG: lipoate--protein ligase family protein [Cyanothece sp. SIO1E1]|nr:lipoate--protein ligase family protein [Cyanothece sp. SIO1E1]